MDSHAVVGKTLKGVEEVETKKYKLSPRARTVLILVDGRKTVAELIDMALKLGSPATLLDEFVAQGLVELKTSPQSAVTVAAPELVQPSAPEMDENARFRAAHKFMTSSVVNTLGIKAFFFTLKLERCATRKDLLAMLDDYTKAIAKGGSAVEAELLTRHAGELLVESRRDVQPAWGMRTPVREAIDHGA